jgi:glucuronate isomerase
MHAGTPDHDQHLEALRTFCISDGIDPALADEVWAEIAEDLDEPERQVRSLHVRRTRVMSPSTIGSSGGSLSPTPGTTCAARPPC